MCVYTHTHTQTCMMDYNTAMQNEQILPFVTTCMNLEDIMLSGRGNWRKVLRKYKLKVNKY